MQAAFPYRRLSERLAAALAGEYDVRVGDVSRGWLLGRFSVEDVRLTTRTPDPITLAFDEIDLDVDIGALLAGRFDLELDGEGRSGRIEGRIHESGADLVVELEVSRAPLGFASIGATSGGAGLSVQLTLPGGNLAAARGDLAFRCDDCSTVEPRVRLGRLDGRLAVKGGVACIGSLVARSDDGELALEGGVRFGPSLGAIEADLLARFRMADAFRAAAPANRELDIRLAGPARLDEGGMAYSGKGRLGALVWRPAPGAPVRPDCAAIGLPARASPVGVANAPVRPTLGAPAPASPAGVASAPVQQTLGLPVTLEFPGTDTAPPVAPPPAPPPLEPEVPIHAPATAPEESPPAVPLEF